MSSREPRELRYCLPASLARRADLTAADKLLIAYIASWAAMRGTCTATIEDAADDLGLSRATVVRSRRKLIAAGIVVASGAGHAIADALPGKPRATDTESTAQAQNEPVARKPVNTSQAQNEARDISTTDRLKMRRAEAQNEPIGKALPAQNEPTKPKPASTSQAQIEARSLSSYRRDTHKTLRETPLPPLCFPSHRHTAGPTSRTCRRRTWRISTIVHTGPGSPATKTIRRPAVNPQFGRYSLRESANF